MTKRRKIFDCGHAGFGSFCHECQRRLSEEAKHQAKREQRRALYVCDQVDLTGLPEEIARKAQQVITSLQKGKFPNHVSAKRFNSDRNIVSIRLNRRYRMVCQEQAGHLTPMRVLSHEDYNCPNKRGVQ